MDLAIEFVGHPFSFQAGSLSSLWKLETKDFVDEFNHTDGLVNPAWRDVWIGIEKTEEPLKGMPVF